jgi:hypothetical protein
MFHCIRDSENIAWIVRKMRFASFLTDGRARPECLELDEAADPKAAHVAHLNSEDAREGEKPARYHVPRRTKHFIRGRITEGFSISPLRPPHRSP